MISFDDLTSFSLVVSKGQGANMLKIGVKRRRTKAEIEEQKQEEIRKEQKIVAELQELAGLRERVQQAEKIAIDNKGAATVLNQMINSG